MLDKKKIVFLNPPLCSSQRYGVLNAAGALEPPLGLAYLAAVTRNIGFETEIVDAQALGLGVEDAVYLILNKKPAYLAITLSTASVILSARVASLIKASESRITVIVGGNHFSALPQETLREHGCFDLGIIGEGEKTIERLLLALCRGDVLETVPGIAFRADGVIRLTDAVDRIDHLDDLPMPAFDLLPDIARCYHPVTQSIKSWPTVSLVTSRGCPGKCVFCDRKTFGNKVRFHSAEYIADMMEKLSKDFGVKGILFEDDNFMLSPERLERLACILKARKINMAWSALSRVDTISEEKVRMAKSCGCWQLLFGIESGSQKILDFYQKGISLSQVRQAIDLAKKHHLFTKGFLMIGNPLETKDTLQETRKLIMSLPLDDVSVTYFTPYPGAEIWDRAGAYGAFDKAWDALTCFDPVFIPHGMSKDELCNFQVEIYRDFYARPRVMLSYLRRLSSFSQARLLWRSFLSLQRVVSASGGCRHKG